MRPADHPERFIGDFRRIHVGHASDAEIRGAGASGGVATAVLHAAIERGGCGAACVVGMEKERPWAPDVRLARTRGELIEASGSKYVLIDTGRILAALGGEAGRVAVVGLPCHVRALRRRMAAGRHGNIALIVGLFCGYNMTPDATDFLLGKAGVRKEEVASLRYRGGPYPGGFLVRTRSGAERFFPKYCYDAVNLIFAPGRCAGCGDYMSELADLSVGDAWGHGKRSVVIARTAAGEEALRAADVEMEEIAVGELFRMHRHNIRHKKSGDPAGLRAAAWFLRVCGRRIPFGLLGLMAGARRKALGR